MVDHISIHHETKEFSMEIVFKADMKGRRTVYRQPLHFSYFWISCIENICAKCITPPIMSQSKVPQRYRAYMLQGVGEPWIIRDKPYQHPSSGEIAIKVICCGLCHTDLDVAGGALKQMLVPQSCMCFFSG